MTTTVTRLYDNYADAERAVRRLEDVGVSHSDVSIVANNSENWYRPGGKVDPIGTELMTEPTVPGPEPESVRGSAEPPVCLPGLVCWPFRGSDLW